MSENSSSHHVRMLGPDSGRVRLFVPPPIDNPPMNDQETPEPSKPITDEMRSSLKIKIHQNIVREFISKTKKCCSCGRIIKSNIVEWRCLGCHVSLCGACNRRNRDLKHQEKNGNDHVFIRLSKQSN